MRTIIVDVDNLESIIEKGYYLNKKYEHKKIKKNVNYKLETQGINFSCELYVDSEGELGITTINGKTPDDCECFYTIEGLGDNEVAGLYGYLAINYGFLSSRNQFEIIFSDTIKSLKNSDFCDLCYDEDTLYFADMTEQATIIYKDYDNESFDRVVTLSFKDIIQVTLDFINEKAYFSVSSKEDTFTVKIGYIEDETIEQLINLRNQINLSILKNKAA